MIETPEISQISDPEAIPNGSVLYVKAHYRSGVYHAVPVVWGEAECKSKDIHFDVRGAGVIGKGFYQVIDRAVYKEKEYFVCQKVDIERDEAEGYKVVILGGYYLLEIKSDREYHVVALN